MIILHVKVYNLILKTLNKKNQKVRILLNKQLSKYLGIDFGIKKSGVSISDSNKLEIIMTINKIDTVVHLAGNASVSAKWDSLSENNFTGTLNVFNACKEAGVKKIIFASSNHAVGLFENDSPYKEIINGDYKNITKNYKLISPYCEVRPDSLYGVSKAFGENLGRFFYEKYNIKVACLRIGSVIKDNNPKVKNSNRFFSTWCSHEDIAGLIDACIKSNKVEYTNLDLDARLDLDKLREKSLNIE